MATQLIRGMGSFFKSCACVRQNRCSHPYAIRYRDATGRQREETGYATQQSALDRLTEVYEEKRNAPRAQADLKRDLGKQRFGEYATSWLTRQRHYTPSGVRAVSQVPHSQVLPVLESRRISTFTSTVVEDSIMSLEERSVGPAAQQNAFDTLKKILLDAGRRGGPWDRSRRLIRGPARSAIAQPHRGSPSSTSIRVLAGGSSAVDATQPHHRRTRLLPGPFHHSSPVA